MVHVREIENASPGVVAKEPTFGHSGLLWHNSYLLYDRETDSLWHHLDGRAMSGPLRGARMRRLPVSFLPFAAWCAEHPATLVLPRPERDPEAGNAETSADGFARRNEGLKFGFGVDGPPGTGAALLVPLDALYSGPFETDLGDVPIVVVATARRTGAAFDRRVGGHTLSFDGDAAGAASAGGRPVLRERGGKRAWWARTGKPVEGSGAEAPLSLLTGSVWETNAWRLQHPGAPVRSRPAQR